MSTRKKVVHDHHWHTWIYKVLKQVHPEQGISKTSMDVMNSLVSDWIEKIIKECVALCLYDQLKTITSRTVQTAIRLYLPPELAKHAIQQGVHAVSKYTAASGVEVTPVPTVETLSKTGKASLVFPVGRTMRILRKQSRMRCGITAPVYLAAVIEYLVAEVLELAGNHSKEDRRNRIIPRHILLTIKTDTELNELLRGAQVASGGILCDDRMIAELKKKAASLDAAHDHDSGNSNDD